MYIWSMTFSRKYISCKPSFKKLEILTLPTLFKNIHCILFMKSHYTDLYNKEKIINII